MARWSQFVVAAVGVLLAFLLLSMAARADDGRAELLISQDGHRVTFQRAAGDAVEVCAIPKQFGPVRCVTVGDIRASITKEGK